MGNCYTCGEGGARGSEITADAPKNYFAFQYGEKYSNTLFQFDQGTKKCQKVTDTSTIDVQEKFSVQVLTDVYTYDHDVQQPSFVRISAISSGRPVKTVMKTPPSSRGFPALCTYNNAYIFVSGGQGTIEFTDEFNTVEFYDVG